MRKPEHLGDNENISSTAWTIAQRRSFTDIAYAQEIFVRVEELRRSQGVEIPHELKSPEIAPQIEARYKLINRLLKQNNITQVLEIAAGFSPRGLEFTDNSQVVYVETDLSGIVSQKKEIVAKISSRENLHIEEGSALNLSSLEGSLKYFDSEKPIGIIHEGLLRYLNFEQKAIVARNIHMLLSQNKGLWITPDITLKATLQAENDATRQSTQRVGEIIGVTIDQNEFEDISHAEQFFENLGFTSEKHSFMEVLDELSSPQLLNQTVEQVTKLIRDAYVFVMREV